MTREEAISALVELDVQRWGEAERAASREMHARLSHGRALNTLANRYEMADKPDPELRKLAKATLTAADRRVLRQGG